MSVPALAREAVPLPESSEGPTSAGHVFPSVDLRWQIFHGHFYVEHTQFLTGEVRVEIKLSKPDSRCLRPGMQLQETTRVKVLVLPVSPQGHGQCRPAGRWLRWSEFQALRQDLLVQ